VAYPERSKYAHLPPVLRAAAERSEACNIATKPDATNTPEIVAAPTVDRARATPSLVCTSTPLTPYPSTPPLSTRLQEAKAQAATLLTRSWRKLARHEKLARAFVVADEAGGVAFTVNLSAALQSSLSSHADPVRLMSHYLNRELKSAIGAPVPYAFRFEVSPTGRLHIHGALIPASLDEEHILAVDRALARAGGKLKADSLRRNTQSYLDHLYDGLGWFAYVQKASNKASGFLGTDKVTFISNDLMTLVNSQ